VLLGLLLAAVIGWIVNLARRPPLNEQGLSQGIVLRSRAKLVQPQSNAEPPALPGRAETPGGSLRRRWPMGTNLTKESVAGPGLLLQFNFQVMVMIWAVGIAIGWVILALAVDTDLFVLGTKRAETPRQSCIVIAWGYETQRRLMKPKVIFLAAAYVGTFLMALIHSVRQLRIFQWNDIRETTHKDFCARVTGLPPIGGEQLAEKELKEHLELATGQKVVGVSICWDFHLQDFMLNTFIEQELVRREYPGETDSPFSSPRIITPRVDRSVAQKSYDFLERLFLSPTCQKIITKGRRNLHREAVVRKKQEREVEQMLSLQAQGIPTPRQEVRIEEALQRLRSSREAFVVYETESARNAAVARAAALGGVHFRGGTLELAEAHNEPGTINWRNCANSIMNQQVPRILGGIGVILLALALWTGCFYLPYAYFAMSFNYSYGQEPGAVSSVTFSMIVVLGNAVMYLVCSEVADRVGFRTVDARETCYMLLYSFACIVNVILDLCITYLVAYRMLVGNDTYTYHGRSLRDVSSFTERFESYAMQRELASAVWIYSFPSTFLVPFIFEPIMTVYVPYKIMSLIIRANPKFHGYWSERYMGSTPMDLSRYADVLLNMTLAVVIFYFPGGYTVRMFVALAASHVFIYGYDHWRVLRSIPKCEFSGMSVDWWAQWMLSVPCGLLLSCALFKASCEGGGGPAWDGAWLLLGCTCAFLGHVALHTLCLLFLVPRLGLRQKEPSRETYRECSRRIACNWFNANPVHCLRSQYVYCHEVPCDYCLPGKEHLLRVNEDLGLHFNDAALEPEDYSKTVDWQDLGRKISGSMRKLHATLSFSSPTAAESLLRAQTLEVFREGGEHEEKPASSRRQSV